MADIQDKIIKFLYASQLYKLDEEPTYGSDAPVKSKGIRKAIDDVLSAKLAILQSGYMTDSVGEKTVPFTLEIKDNVVRLGSATKEQTLWAANGIESGTNKYKFRKITLEAGRVVDTIDEVATIEVPNCEVFICYDFVANKLVALPQRTAITGTPNVLQWMYAQPEDAVSGGPVVDPSKTDIVWWDYTHNYLKRQAGGVWYSENVNLTIPLGLGLRINGHTTTLLQSFNMMGYCGKLVWMVPSAFFVFPNGRVEDKGIIKVETSTPDNVIVFNALENKVDKFIDNYIFLTQDDKLFGPADNCTFDFEKGFYSIGDGVDRSLCRVAFMSAGYVNPGNPSEPLYVTSLAPFNAVTLATSDDIENVMRIINNVIKYEISLLHNELDNVENVLDNVVDRTTQSEIDITENNRLIRELQVNSLRKHQYNLKKELAIPQDLEKIKNPVVGDAYYVKSTFSFYVWNGTEFKVIDESTYEVIDGIKEFKEDIIGNLNGVAKYTKKVYEPTDTSVKIMPIGVPVKSEGAYGDTDEQHIITTVQIGKNSVYAENFYGTASKAKYADLAEIYASDNIYEEGTLIKFGGSAEITIACNGEVNGVISDKPAFLMNSEAEGLPVALVGRVPVKVIGPIKKFQNITLSTIKGIATVAHMGDEVIGKALESVNETGVHLIECVVKFKLD